MIRDVTEDIELFSSDTCKKFSPCNFLSLFYLFSRLFLCLDYKEILYTKLIIYCKSLPGYSNTLNYKKVMLTTLCISYITSSQKANKRKHSNNKRKICHRKRKTLIAKEKFSQQKENSHSKTKFLTAKYKFSR